MQEFLPAFKGYERLGQFPLDNTSVFESLTQAEKYARLGLTKASSAYSGQIISVKEDEKFKAYMIGNNFELTGIISSTASESGTYYPITYDLLNTSSGYGKLALSIAEGSFLKSLTVKIIEPFRIGNGKLISDAFMVGSNYLPTVGEGHQPGIYMDENDFLTDEIGDYTVFINKTITEETNQILIIANPDNTYKSGYAILKIN